MGKWRNERGSWELWELMEAMPGLVRHHHGIGFQELIMSS